MPMRPGRLSGLALAVALMLYWTQSWAQGETGPPGMQHLPAALLMITLFPFIGIALSFPFFRITGSALVFFLAPIFHAGLFFLTPRIIPGAPSDPPGLFSAAGAWLYWAHVPGIAGAYALYARRRKAWFFWLSPLVGWLLQIVILLVLIAWL